MYNIVMNISSLSEFINDIDMLATNMETADEVIGFRIEKIIDDVFSQFKDGSVNKENFEFTIAVYEDIRFLSNVMYLCQKEGRSISEWSDSIKQMKAKLKLLILKLEGKF